MYILTKRKLGIPESKIKFDFSTWRVFRNTEYYSTSECLSYKFDSPSTAIKFYFSL